MFDIYVMRGMAAGIKEATTRFEREIATGNLSRGDVTPGVPNLPGFLNPVSRKQTRDILAAPAAVDPATLERTRRLKGLQHPAQIAAAGSYVPKAVGSLEPMPKGYAATKGTSTGQFAVHAPLQTGQFMRTAGGGDIVGALRGEAVASQPALAGALLRPAQPQDRTIGQAIAQHEIGEAAELSRAFTPAGLRPYASHLGVEPVLREQQALRGDPDAVRDMNRARSIHPDDKRMQGYIRQAGGTADAPLPLGGRQQRAVERMLDRNSSQISAHAKAKALKAKDMGVHVPYVPSNIPTVLGLTQGGVDMVNAPTLRGKFDKGIETAKGFRRYMQWLRPH